MATTRNLKRSDKGFEKSATLIPTTRRSTRHYKARSQRMKDRYDLFGSLPDMIEGDRIENIELLDEPLSQFT
jgi:hypothetical protein